MADKVKLISPHGSVVYVHADELPNYRDYTPEVGKKETVRKETSKPKSAKK